MIRLSSVPQWQLALGGLLASVAIAAGWLHEHDRRVEERTTLAAQLKGAQQREAVATEYAKVANAKVVHDSVRVTRTLHRVDTLWADLPLDPITHLDSVRVFDALPVLRRATDSAIASCSDFQTSCAEYRRQSDSLIRALRGQRDILTRRVKVERPSRWGSVLKWAEIGGASYIGYRVGKGR